MAEGNGINLVGPSFQSVFPKINESLLLKSMLECLDWYANNSPNDGYFQCACRVMHYLESGTLVSKKEAVSNQSLAFQDKQVFIDSVLAKLRDKVTLSISETVQ